MSDHETSTTARAERVQAICEEIVADGRVPGVVALVARGDDVHVEAHGRLAVGGAPMTRDALFRIASVTKPITAAATLAVAREGLLDLDAPVDGLLPELADRRVLRRMDGPLDETVPAARPITARDLLTFTFGFGLAVEMFMSPEPWPVVAAARRLRLSTIEGPPERDVQPDADTWIAHLGQLPLLAQPGERWLYNTGASVLGVLVGRAAGASFGEVLRTRLLAPLGMHDTAYRALDPARLTTAYRPTPEGLVPRAGDYRRPPAFEDGAAGLVATADDLLAFARMFLAGGGGVLDPEDVRAMTRDQLSEAQKAHGGLGPGFFDRLSWGFGQAVHADGSFGWDGGSGVSWRVDPARELVVIVLTQREFEDPAGPSFHAEIRAAAGIGGG